MKKTAIFILIGIISFLLLSACSPTVHPADDPAELETTAFWGISIQPNKTHLPSTNDLDEIQVGMSMDEVLKKIGHPQRFSVKHFTFDPNTSSGTLVYRFYIYDSQDGDSISVIYTRESADDDSLIVKYIVKNDIEKTWDENSAPFLP